LRVLHFSDVHVGSPLRSVPVTQWLGKRALGGANLVLRRRGRRFARARLKLEALAEATKRLEVELVIFSGDYTAMGLEAEYVAARAAVEPLLGAPAGYVNVPGNHDLYVAETVRRQRFEHHFGDTLWSDLPEHRANGAWPLVRLAGAGVAVVCVDSARPNPPWRSSGRIPEAQLAALVRVLDDPRVRERFVFVVTHYAPRLADGGPDTRYHGLDNAEAFLRACGRLERGAILCGHVHHPFSVRVPASPVPIFCAGSATMDGRESFWLFDVGASSCRVLAGRWSGQGYEVAPAAAVEAGPSGPVDSRKSIHQA
jgi:3',5'-cyclic AMP phosphodiesterase CpdA